MLDENAHVARTPEENAAHLAGLRQFAQLPARPFNASALREQTSQLSRLVADFERPGYEVGTAQAFIASLKTLVESISIGLKSLVALALEEKARVSPRVTIHAANNLLVWMGRISGPHGGTQEPMPIGEFRTKLLQTDWLASFKGCISELTEISDLLPLEPSAGTQASREVNK